MLLVQRLAVQKPAKLTVGVTSYHVTSHGDQNYIVAPEVVALYSLGQEYAISDF